MIVSLAELVILSFIVDWCFRKLTVPGLVGMRKEQSALDYAIWSALAP